MLVEIVLAVGVLIIVVGVLAYVAGMYNRLVRVDERVDNAWADIDIKLQERRDSLTKLVDTVEQAMSQEEDVLTELVNAREAVEGANSPAEHADAGEQMKGALGMINARAEDYPELKSISNLQSLQDDVANIEAQISDRREVYNETVTNYNQLIRSIPYLFVAGSLGFQKRELYEPPEGKTEDVDMGELFDSEA